MKEDILKQLDVAVNAEDFLELFELDYDPNVVRVNRLHILKKFALFKDEIDADGPEIPAEERYTRYRGALIRAYETFLERTSYDERLFKVFQNPTAGAISISALTGK